MNDTIGNIATPAKDPLVQYVAESLQQSFDNGFELARVRVLRIIHEEFPNAASLPAGAKMREVIHRIEQLMPDAQQS